ncbi:MAG: PLP-dependent aminotransferase family protein [Firmicutes bacterium]|nr:PLP-dependent aminotransferase family protein [Bacillota bacterium]
MLTYELKKERGLPLYEALYRSIRQDILTGKLAPGDKLPSKRALAAHLKVSQITVEGAYDQLLSEGYIRTRQRVGCFVEPLPQLLRAEPENRAEPESRPFSGVDLTANGPADFPFSVWSRLFRQVMQDYGRQLLSPLPNRGYGELRSAIASSLAQFRGMSVSADQILVGAGTDFLYNLLIQLLGRDLIYAVEEPGYDKITRIYAAGGARYRLAPMDDRGVIPGNLTDAQVLHISPAHHFPTGLVTPLDRRQELLDWLRQRQDRYIIEDDFDSEFRFHARPLPTLQTMDTTGRVIYMNTFTKTLAPSIRISYLVLPTGLMERFSRELGFYGCTGPSFEQYTLARFLNGGYFEKHINRMRKFYRNRRNRMIELLRTCAYASRLTIREQDAGLHFLVKVDTDMTDEALTAWLAEKGIRVQCLSSFYRGPYPEEVAGNLVVNYSGLSDGDMDHLASVLGKTQDV